VGENPPDPAATNLVADPGHVALNAAVPRAGFSRAIRTTESHTSSLTGGRAPEVSRPAGAPKTPVLSVLDGITY
jgi:hypothetical protein